MKVYYSTQNKLRFFLITVLYLFVAQNAYNQSKIYFDQEWKISDKENAHFYRVITKKNDSLFHVKDYYINGALQMDGYYSNIKEGTMEGKNTWYYKNKRKMVSSMYSQGKLHGLSTVYQENGKLHYRLEYKDGDPYNGNYKTSITDGIEYIYKNGATLKRIEHGTVNGFYPAETRVYGTKKDSVYWRNSNGKLIGVGIYDAHTHKIINGLDIKTNWLEVTNTYYKKGKKDGIQNMSFEGTLFVEKTFKNDTLTLHKSLDPFTNKMIECEYKNNEPVQGRFFEYDQMQDFYDEYVYVNGEFKSRNRYIKKGDTYILKE